ncbi:hypothetical protein ARMGADRAFT_287739 [Armillaria gallica]|uniref:Uncharacterized protein n=1 Tax=Armillaria gallica TaxID=47427 RepID=A0A2H3DS87_ARMGA|nr:hypothetical protein ARMGADRAFT_287739 [Armillaria gallica]
MHESAYTTSSTKPLSSSPSPRHRRFRLGRHGHLSRPAVPLFRSRRRDHNPPTRLLEYNNRPFPPYFFPDDAMAVYFSKTRLSGRSCGQC